MRGISGALAEHLSGFRPPLLPRYAGLSTILDAIISDLGPLARLRRGFDFDAILDYTRRERWENVRTQNGDEERKVCTSLKSIYSMLVLDHPLNFVFSL